MLVSSLWNQSNLSQIVGNNWKYYGLEYWQYNKYFAIGLIQNAANFSFLNNHQLFIYLTVTYSSRENCLELKIEFIQNPRVFDK